MPIATVAWEEGRMRIVDQTLLPGELKYLFLDLSLIHI